MTAKRGDLLVIERKTSYVTTSEGYHESLVYEAGKIVSVTRDGVAKAISTRYSDSTPLGNIFGVQRTFVVPQSEIDVQPALEAVWANEWKPGYPGKPFDSLDDLKAVLRPFLVGAVAA